MAQARRLSKKSLEAYAACLQHRARLRAGARVLRPGAARERGPRRALAAQLAYLKQLKADDLAKQLEDAIAAAPTVKESTKAKDASTTGAGSRCTSRAQRNDRASGAITPAAFSCRGVVLADQRYRSRLAHIPRQSRMK